jgi:signal peptidase II
MNNRILEYSINHVWVATALAMVLSIVDAVAKYATTTTLPKGSVVVIPHVLSLFLHFNPGVVANIAIPMTAVIIISFAVMFLCAAWLRQTWIKEQWRLVSGIIILMFGAIGNLTDRMADGFTTDYLLLAGGSVVNISDGLILIGIIWILFASKKKKSEKKA